jgi:hypothetical protein
VSYGVLWSRNGDPACVGRLEVDHDRLVLEGSLRGRREHAELSRQEITSVHVGRSATDRLGGRAVLVLGRMDGKDVRVAPIGAVGVLHELLDLVNRWRTNGAQAASKSA